MAHIALKIASVIFIFALGYILKRIRLLKPADGDVLMKIVFYVAAPCLIFLSVSKAEITTALLLLPLSAGLIIFTTFWLAYYTAKFYRLPPSTFGAFLAASLIMNNGFMMSFVFAVFGEDGLARLVMFDFANGLITFTFVYYLACRYGAQQMGKKVKLHKFFLAPPLWGLLIGLLFNLAGIEVGKAVTGFLQPLASLLIPLIMLSLGIYFTPRFTPFKPMITAVILRMGVGFLLGLVFIELFGFEGLNKKIVLLCSMAPVGFNTIVFASLEKLDKQFAAGVVSLGIITGVIVIPLVILLIE